MSSLPQLKSNFKFKVEVIAGPHSGAVHSFDKDTITIGRGPENDIILSNDLRVSRQHAEIKLTGADYNVVNLSQKNFVLVNGVRVQSEKLETDAIILIGESEMKFTPAGLPPVNPIKAAHDAAGGIVIPIRSPAASVHTSAGISAMTSPSIATSSGFATAPGMPPMGASNNQMAPRPMQQAPLGYPVQNQTHPKGNLPPLGSAAVNGGPSFGGNRMATSGGKSKVRFYIIVGALGLLGWFVLSPGKKPLKDPNAIRTTEQIASDLQTADKMIEQLEKRKSQLSEVQSGRAQENFIKGFRDYQQGQYARARESFQVVLNLDSENELAKRYLQLSRIKFDEMVKHSMLQGSRYREKKSWRLCQSSFFNVMTMLQNRKDDAVYQEAKRYYDECALNMVGRF